VNARATFLLLLFVNLAFLGWAALIDAPPEPPQSDSISNLPQLKLLSEVRRKASSLDPAPSAGAGAVAPATPATGSNTTSVPAANGSAGTATSVEAPSAGVPSAAAAPSGANSAGSAAPPAQVAASAIRRCITIGPFTDPENAREAADVLRERGFMPRARTAAGGSPQGYWVFVGGLKTPADETSVLHRLERNGIADAKVMPTSNAGRRVSVGLFNSRDGAERRASAVRRLGLEAQVEPRPAAEVHWVDVDLDSSGQSLPAEGLLSLEEAGSRLEIKECPAPAPGAPSGRLTAGGRSGPG